MIERRSILDAGSERLKVPQVTQGAENGRGRVRDDLALGVKALLLHRCLANPWGDEEGWDTTSETVEGESVLLTGRGRSGVGEVVGRSGKRRRNVVVETTTLVEGQDEQALVPLGACAESVIDAANKLLAVGNETAWVHGGGTNAAAGGVDVAEFREVASGGISVEVVKIDDLVVIASGIGPAEV